MFSARSCDRLEGMPPVSARFWSKSLNPVVNVRNVQMVMEGMEHGQLDVAQRLPGGRAVDGGGLAHVAGMDCRPEM